MFIEVLFTASLFTAAPVRVVLGLTAEQMQSRDASSIYAQLANHPVIDVHALPFALVVTVPDKQSAERLLHVSHVRWAELDTQIPVTLRAVPNDPLYAKQWHLHPSPQSHPDTHVGAEAAWDITTGIQNSGRPVRIAIIDDGFDLAHPDLIDRLTDEKRDFSVDPYDDDPSPDFGDYHGTQTAGTAAATGFNGIGVSGVCPACQLLPIRLIGRGGPSDLFITGSAAAAAFVWAVDNGADVINNSWGPPDGNPLASTPSSTLWTVPQVLTEAIEYATAHGRNGLGTIIVWSAGNGAEYATYDRYVSDPRVIGVGSVTAAGTLSFYSDFGPTVDLVAPSSGSYGQPKINTTDLTGLAGMSDTDYSDQYGGTSAAGAVVSGAAGLVIAAHPHLTAAQITEALMLGGYPIDPVRADYVNGRSPIYGYGRVDVPRALAVAALYTNSCTTFLEICDNGQDDNCNGEIDEDCTPCVPDKPTEICDGKDNNCDGRIDEGAVCQTAGRSNCSPCTTADQCAPGMVCRSSSAFRGTWCLRDCSTDNTCGYGFSCQRGVCHPIQTSTMLDCNDFHTCDAVEQCDGIDNDCNGLIDDIDPDDEIAQAATAQCAQEHSDCPDRSALCANGIWYCAAAAARDIGTQCSGLTTTTVTPKGCAQTYAAPAWLLILGCALLRRRRRRPRSNNNGA